MSCKATRSATGAIALATALILSLLPESGQAAAAGRVIFAAGAPRATDSAGAERSLKRGDDVFAGETLATDAAGRLQVSFVDGAYISLQPDSRYAIEQYEYSGRQDGSEKAVYRLLKGGVRALTGAIGKQNPDAYRVETPVATIGIRGSGHNSRICASDCPSGRRNGLYHNTWRGLTYVKNTVDERDVPRGRGVFVADLNSPIEFLDQPPALTAVDTGSNREQEQEKQEDHERRFQAGDQRDEDGDQIILREDEEPPPPPPPPPEVTSTVITGLVLQGVSPDPDQPDSVDVFSYEDVSIFLRDSDESPVGILGLLDEETGPVLELATIDPDAVLGGDITAAVDVGASLLEMADPGLVSFFAENPAHTEDFFYNGEVGLGRWTDGRILVVNEFGETEVPEFTGFQSAHFIFGQPSPLLPTTGFATYEFLAGTRSTSVSGATIGQGVTGGFIQVDFGASSAFLEMDVVHDSVDYFVSGNLFVDTSDQSFFDSSVIATTELSTSGCFPSCPTFIDGGFAGPGVGGVPKYAGFEYDIQNTLDVITGVAGFQLAGPGP